MHGKPGPGHWPGTSGNDAHPVRRVCDTVDTSGSDAQKYACWVSSTTTLTTRRQPRGKSLKHKSSAVQSADGAQRPTQGPLTGVSAAPPPPTQPLPGPDTARVGAVSTHSDTTVRPWHTAARSDTHTLS